MEQKIIYNNPPQNEPHKPIAEMSTEELQWRIDNPDAAKWFDAFKAANQDWITLAKGAVELKKENTQLKQQLSTLQQQMDDSLKLYESQNNTIIKLQSENEKLKEEIKNFSDSAIIDLAFNPLKDTVKELEQRNETLLKALRDLYNSVDSCIDLTPDVMNKAKQAIEQNK